MKIKKTTPWLSSYAYDSEVVTFNMEARMPSESAFK